MGLISWLKERRKKGEAEKQEKPEFVLGTEAEETQPLAEADPDIVPAETRFTEEYQEFLGLQDPVD